MDTAHAGSAAAVRPGLWPRGMALLLAVVEALAAVLLAADLAIVMFSVLARFFFDAPPVWSDDAARTLLLAVSFLGAAAALARGENAGATFFVDRLGARARARADALVGVAVVLVSGALTWNGVVLLLDTAGQTVGAGVPQEAFFAPLCLAAVAMTVFAPDGLRRHRPGDAAGAAALLAAVAGAWWGWSALEPDSLPGLMAAMGRAFVAALAAGVPIAFVLALSTLVFIWGGDMLPGEFFAQQLARGIDNFVLLAVPFFILVGYLMEANGMSVRLIGLL